jgi:uncharacterized membrane protein
MKPRAVLLCLLMIVVMCVVTAYLYPRLPATLPMHWNAAGQVDGYGPRWQIWLLGPGAMGACCCWAWRYRGCRRASLKCRHQVLPMAI